MKTQNYWQQFLNTGRIEDYLSYVQDSADGARQTGAESREEHTNAGFYMCDRNDIETGTHRGI